MVPKITTIKVTPRPGGKPLRGLPKSIDVDTTTTIEDAKRIIARAAGGRDPNRVGIYDPSKDILRNRKAILMDQPAVVEGQEILVKDLGAQISWKLTFVIEYIGPIIFNLMFLFARPYIYFESNPISNWLLNLGVVKRGNDHLSDAQKIAMAMIVLHFAKRELEVLFLHRFSAASMPAYMIVRNSWHYWVSAGLQLAFFIYAPNATSAQPIDDTFTKSLIYVGIAFYVVGETINLYTHIVLSRLRKPGGTERGIPRGFSFDWVTCPNYIWESLAWIGIIMVTRSLHTVYFLVWGLYYMQIWSQGKENAYRRDFGSKYKAKRYPLLPGMAFKPPKRSKLEATKTQ